MRLYSMMFLAAAKYSLKRTAESHELQAAWDKLAIDALKVTLGNLTKRNWGG